MAKTSNFKIGYITLHFHCSILAALLLLVYYVIFRNMKSYRKKCCKTFRNLKWYWKGAVKTWKTWNYIENRTWNFIKRCQNWLFSKVHNPKLFFLANQGGRHFLRLGAVSKKIPSYVSETSYIPQNTPRCMNKVLTHFGDIFWKMTLP